jgi:hypothetical protein
VQFKDVLVKNYGVYGVRKVIFTGPTVRDIRVTVKPCSPNPNRHFMTIGTSDLLRAPNWGEPQRIIAISRKLAHIKFYHGDGWMTSRGINADSLVDESTPIEVHPGGSPFVLSDHANPWQRCLWP